MTENMHLLFDFRSVEFLCVSATFIQSSRNEEKKLFENRVVRASPERTDYRHREQQPLQAQKHEL